VQYASKERSSPPSARWSAFTIAASSTRSATILRMSALPLAAIADDVARTLEAAANPESYVRIMVTRGEPLPGAPLGLAIDPRALVRRFVLVEPLRPIAPETYSHGVRAITVTIPRAEGTSAAKLLPYVVNMLALDDARARGANDAIFVDPSGLVLEGATSNVFIVKNGRLATANDDEAILAGITRAHVLDLAHALRLGVDLAAPPVPALYDADEAFLTSSLREIVPIVTIDDRPIGSGLPGPITRALHDALRARIGAAAIGDRGLA
jgi:branched-chain amino acid aminotransferase